MWNCNSNDEQGRLLKKHGVSCLFRAADGRIMASLDLSGTNTCSWTKRDGKWMWCSDSNLPQMEEKVETIIWLLDTFEAAHPVDSPLVMY